MLSGISSSTRGLSPVPVRVWLVLCAMSMLQFFIAVDVTVVNITLPSIGADFGVEGHSLTWVVVGYTITGGGLLMLGGRLGDLLGRRRTLLVGTTLFGAASLLAGLAPSFPVLVAARLLQGAGEAIALPAAMATIVLLFPEGPRRSRALSVWAAVASCGLVLGFALSGIITAHLGWRWIFLISVPFILVVIVAALVLVPADRSRSRERVRLDLPGSLLLTACPLLFVYAAVEAGEPGTNPWVSVAALVGSVLAAVGFVWVESKSQNPLVPLAFFADRARLRANLTTMLLSGALSTSFLLFTFYLQERLEIGPLGAGLAMLPLAVALIAASVLVPRLLGRTRLRSGRAHGCCGRDGGGRACGGPGRWGSVAAPCDAADRGRNGIRTRGSAVHRGQRDHRRGCRDRIGRPASGGPARRSQWRGRVRGPRVRPGPARRRSLRDRCGARRRRVGHRCLGHLPVAG